MMVLEEYDSLLNHLKTRMAIAEEYLARHFLGIQQSLGDGKFDNAYWLPGLGNSAGGLT